MLVDFNKKYPNIRKRLLKPLLFNCNPNIITFLALLAAMFSGYLFYIDHIIIASFLLLTNGFLDILDGEIAKKFNRQSKLGDFLDHSIDRIADIFIFFGIAMNPDIPILLGFVTILFVLLVSYMGTQYQALTNKRLYGGLFGRSDRILFMFLFGIGSLFFGKSLYYGVWFVLIMSVITFLQRFYKSYESIKNM